MDNRWEMMIKDNLKIVDEINMALLTAKLLNYNVKVRYINDKRENGICFDFIKHNKRLHLDIFFNEHNKLKDICACMGNRKPFCSDLNNQKLNSIKELIKRL